MSEPLVLTIAGKARTGKSTTARLLAENNPFPIVRHSALIELYAKANKLPLSRQDRSTYDEAYSALDHEDPHHLTDLVLEMTLNRYYPLIIIDGLRVYRDARLFKDALGDRYLTAALTAPDAVRNARDNAERAEAGLDLCTPEQFLASEASNEDADYGMADVIGMHDISPSPIDTSVFKTTNALATHVWQLVRPHVTL